MLREIRQEVTIALRKSHSVENNNEESIGRAFFLFFIFLAQSIGRAISHGLSRLSHVLSSYLSNQGPTFFFFFLSLSYMKDEIGTKTFCSKCRQSGGHVDLGTPYALINEDRTHLDPQRLSRKYQFCPHYHTSVRIDFSGSFVLMRYTFPFPNYYGMSRLYS